MKTKSEKDAKPLTDVEIHQFFKNLDDLINYFTEVENTDISN